jgi:DNA transposition AAA+ family ATPase
MKHEEKQAVKEAALAYMQEKGLSQNKFAKIIGVNASYMSNILNGVFTYTHSKTGEDRDIDDRWFAMIADAIGFSLKKEYWPLVETDQFIDIAKELTEAKRTSKPRIIIGETGCGKSYTVERFTKAYPGEAFNVTCNKNDTISDLVRKIQTALKLNFEGSNSYRIDRISMELYKLSQLGLSPIITFDESEYLSVTGLLSLKTIYDYLKDMCSITLIGTSDLLNKLERSRKREGMPQFIRRFKAGIRVVRPIDRTFSRFFEGKGISKGLRDILTRNADNYGELADYLEPAIREADRRGVALTEEFFNSMFYLQNN